MTCKVKAVTYAEADLMRFCSQFMFNFSVSLQLGKKFASVCRKNGKQQANKATARFSVEHRFLCPVSYYTNKPPEIIQPLPAESKLFLQAELVAGF